MDEEIERLVVGVRADTAGFARDVDTMRASLTGPLAGGAAAAAGRIDASLARAIAGGKSGFDDLGKTALKVLAEIAAAALKSSIGPGGSAGGGGLTGILTGLIGGLAGRATGGPVSPGTPYIVGERGPELFVPTSAGQVMPNARASARGVQVAITINAPAGDSAAAMARSSRQVARAVRAALQDGG